MAWGFGDVVDSISSSLGSVSGTITNALYDPIKDPSKDLIKFSDDLLVEFDSKQREKFVQGHKDLSVFAYYSYVDNMNFLKQLIDPWKETHKLLGHDLSRIDAFENKAFAAGKGFDYTFNAALDGDKEAQIMIAMFVVSILLTIFTWGSSSEFTGATIAEIISYASAASQAYQYGERYAAVSEIKDKYDELMRNLAKIQKETQNGYVDDAIYGQKNDWMAGGTFYNAIYAGGELFNRTGSRAQTNFLGVPDANINNRFMWNNDRYHDFYKRIGTERIGTDNFSILKFSMV